MWAWLELLQKCFFSLEQYTNGEKAEFEGIHGTNEDNNWNNWLPMQQSGEHIYQALNQSLSEQHLDGSAFRTWETEQSSADMKKHTEE